MLPQKRYDKINYILLIIAFIGVSTTKIALSWCTVLFAANFLFTKGLKDRFKLVWANKVNRWIIAFILLNIIGLIWSPDTKAGIKLLKNYMPLLIIPMIALTTKWEPKQIRIALRWFIAGLTFTSLFNFLYINQVFGPIVGDDIREMSRFGSHTRYALLIVLGVLTCIESIRKEEYRLFPTYIAVGLGLWFSFYTLYAQILSGVICLVGLLFFYALLLVWKTQKLVLLVSFLTIIFSIVLFVGLKLFPATPAYTCADVSEKTKLGNTYINNCQYLSEINGLPVHGYYQEEELRTAWNEKSKLDFDGVDNRQHPLKVTIARYMTALQLRKDYSDFQKLTKEDIAKIELGKVYPNENQDLLFSRLYSLKYEIMYADNPNGKSLLQRIEHWKASIKIIQKNPILGVGTGGNQKAFDQAYEEMNSPLYPENRMRSHNMFFAIQIGLGVAGSIIFMGMFIQLIREGFRLKNAFALGAILVLLTSFLMEDTLETQVGIYIMALFILPIFQNRTQNTLKTE